MRIVLATPLYPPDIENPAPYIKELAKRLANKHTITIVTYGHLPEKVPGVKIIAVDKRRPLLLRLIAFTRALRQEMRDSDVLYIQNGSSVELPFLLTLDFYKTLFIFGISDKIAHTRAKRHFFAHTLERAVTTRVHNVIKDFPDIRPEILPFVPYPKDRFVSYEHSWQKHIEQLSRIFNHYV